MSRNDESSINVCRREDGGDLQVVMSVRHVGAMSERLLEADLGLAHPALGVEDVAEIAEGLGRIDLKTGSEECLLVPPVLIAENSSGGGRQDHDKEPETRSCCQDFASTMMRD